MNPFTVDLTKFVKISNFEIHFSKGSFDQIRINCAQTYSELIIYLKYARILIKYS